MAKPEELPEPWTLFTDGSSCIDGSGAGLILTNPEGIEFTYAMRFRFEATNNEAEYEALITGLRIAEQMGIKNLQANVDSRLVANQVNGSYVAKESGMVQYLEKVKTLASNFKEFSIKQVPRSENKKADALSKIASTSFTHLRGRANMDDTHMRIPYEGNPSGRQKESKGGTSQGIPVHHDQWNFIQEIFLGTVAPVRRTMGRIFKKKAKNDQTKHGMEKTKSIRSQSQPKSVKVKSQTHEENTT
ncbi:reverse transcriptase domain-containing protein [Tanacetum coccineum]